MANQSPRVVATIIWAALLAGPTVFLGVALYIVFGLRGGTGVGVPLAQPALLIGGSLALSVVTVALSWLWAVRMRVTPPVQGDPRATAAAFPPGPEANAVARLIVACALCEGGALAALVVFLQTGAAPALAPYALSWLALAAHFPGDRHWAQLAGGTAGAAASMSRPYGR